MSKHSCAVSVVHESRGACKEGAETTELLADAAVNVDEEEGARKRNQFYGEPNGAKRERKRECGNYCIFLGKGEIGKADCLLCLSKWGLLFLDTEPIISCCFSLRNMLLSRLSGM